MKKIFTGVMLGLIVASTGAYADVNNPHAKVTDLHTAKDSNGISYVDGLVQNTSDHVLTMMAVKVNLLKNGVVVADTIGMAQNIQPEQSWKLHAAYPDTDKPDTFQVTEVMTLPH
ncbi:FxLYD domain-containing protein [Erwinia amylovora]|uniref:FxLYD domain-containing protein n=1 Tax=Erwinia amylovora TaxID=552 RepID=UPI000C06C4BE|nr:FxLYD domain-containing protein [Erwinia amylovora]